MVELDLFSWLVLGLVGCFVILFCWLIYLQICFHQLKKTVNSITDSFNDIDSSLNKVAKITKSWDFVLKAISDLQNTPSRSVDTESIDILNSRCDSIEQRLENIQMMEPESKMYNRAVKMVKAGASINEVMMECELPRPEAELLFSIHNPDKLNMGKR